MSRKEQIFRLFDNPVAERSISLLHQITTEPDDFLRILTYHRVDYLGNRPQLSPSLLSAVPQEFDKQMRMIREQFNPISIYDVLAYYQEGKKLPSRAVLVTFDDAYRDFEEQAWNLLKKYEIPVTLFVATSFPDSPERRLWWDEAYHAIMTTEIDSLQTQMGLLDFNVLSGRVNAFKKVREYIKSLPHTDAMQWIGDFCEQLKVKHHPDNSILGWDALRQLADEGVTLAPHSHTHPMMNRITGQIVREEIKRSWQILSEKIQKDIVPVFAYPSGQVNDQTVQILKTEGIQVAFTTQRGINHMEQANPLLLKRINIGKSTPLSLINAQLLSWSHYLI